MEYQRNRAERNFATLPDPVATARGSDTASKRLGYGKVAFKLAHCLAGRIASLVENGEGCNIGPMNVPNDLPYGR
jgi:hypothetical protein